jgi:hypothetical protein
MIHDKIQLAIQEVRKMEDGLKEARKAIREEEKIDDESYLELKTGLKDMKAQVKDYEDDQLLDLQQSESYNQLRENKMKAEEELAHSKEQLFKFLAEAPLKPFEMDMKGEEGFTKIQAVPEMRIYVNGKEVKK